MLSIHYSCQTLMKLDLHRHILDKHSNNKFHENSSSVSRVALCRQTGGRIDIYDEVNSRFS
jgi:hypothetical protein